MELHMVGLPEPDAEIRFSKGEEAALALSWDAWEAMGKPQTVYISRG